jgi:hypothetical protein
VLVAAAITLAIYVLATARGIQLVTADKITEGLRKRWLKRHPETTLPGYLIVCAWCTSIYLAVGPAVSWVLAPEHRVLKSCAAVMAFSWLAVGAHKLLHLLDAKIAMFSPPVPPAGDEVTNGEHASS